MGSSNLKTFAQEARRELRKQVGLRLDYVLGTDSAELRQRAAQVKALKEALEREGRDGLIERVAYTWFNRLAALRFMDANGYHPFGVRVITPASEQETLPELLQHARAGALDPELRTQLDTSETFDGVLSGTIPTSSREGTAYRMLLVAACHYYHRLMPFLFEQLGDATELLLPDDLLTEHSIVHSFRSGLTDEDCREVETLGWFYQYYISEKKDEVMGRKTVVPKEDIPAVTQLFTPHWIVRYLVENSLGRLWLLNRPHSKLREKMPYYIEGEAEVDFLRVTRPEDVRLLDPAGGSGHMLTYAFDLLYSIYEEEGYDAPEIPSLILRHNLYGVDICDRAVALAAFALCMKARAKDNRFFRRVVQPHLISLQEIRFAENELRDYIQALALGDLFTQPVRRLLHQFEESKNFGSLIQPCLDERAIADTRRTIEAKDLGGQLFLRETHLKVLRLLEQAEALTRRYHVVVANPPYQEQDDMNGRLRLFIDSDYRNGNTDLCCAFMFRNQNLTYPGGFVGMITMQSWMFLVGSSALRDYFTRNSDFDSMIHLGPRAFDSIPGEVVQTTAFVFVSRQPKKRPQFFRLVSGRNEREKESLFLARQHRFDQCDLADFRRIAASPFAYWASAAVFRAFEGHPAFADCADPCQGLSTGDTPRFLRYWHEVSHSNSEFSAANSTAALDSGRKWFPIDKGGPPRRWFGNNDFLVNWFRDGEEVRNLKTSGGKQKSYARNSRFYFDPGVTWTKVSSGPFASRLTGAGFIFSDAGMKVFAKDEAELRYIACFLNSRVANYLLGFLSETINYEQGNLARLPLARVDLDEEVGIALLDNARADWDNFDTSWNFRNQPLLRPGLKGATLEVSWRNWEAQSTATIRRMQELETENNRLFISAYGLDGELQPEVPEDQITLARPEVKKDMAALIAYAVGCMFGRYSLDQPGLILANAGDSLREFLEKVGKPLAELTFTPDEDGIIPVLDGEWFEDDIVARTRDFLRATFSDATLAENVRFIETSLGKELRKYFMKEFYKDHLQTYKKRPIYWMVSSPEGSFQALLYLHRYTRDTVNTLLNEYVREFIGKLDAHQKQLTAVNLNESARSSDRTKAAKEIAKIDKMLKELRAWEREVVLPLAQQRIALDLDDGVKVNYLKFRGLFVPIPGLEKKEEE